MSGAISFEDVRHVTADDLRARLGCLPDVVVGSPPCPDFSPANHRARGIAGDSGSLALEWCRVVREVRPRWAACETGARLLGAGSDRIAQELEGAGYAVWAHGVAARDVGARHHRDRAWLIAADPYSIDLRVESGRCGWSGGSDEMELVERHPRDPDADRDHEHGKPVDGEMAGLVGAVDAMLGRGWVRGAGRLLGLLGLAHGAEPGMARALASAVGDSVHFAIPEAIGRVMMELAGGETFIDLFSGAVGGWSIGLEAAGMRCLAYAEADPWRRWMYAACRANDGAGMEPTNMPPARSAAA